MNISSGLPSPPLQPGPSSQDVEIPDAPPIEPALPAASASASASSLPPSTAPPTEDTTILSHTLDALLNQITTTTNLPQLNHQLRTCAPREAREEILAGLAGDGRDPLEVLQGGFTLGVLYILSARLLTSESLAPPVQWPYIAEFCRSFDPEQARLAPDRVTLLAKGILAYTEEKGEPEMAIQPLGDLLMRYPPSICYLTTIHPIFIRLCVSTRSYALTLPILSVPITHIDTSLSDLHYTDHLIYHYAGGLALAALHLWSEAEEFFEICVSAPGGGVGVGVGVGAGGVVSAVQVEALKKMVLVQLIWRGKTIPPPKYTNPILVRLLKSTPYTNLMNLYPHSMDRFRAIVEKENQLFVTDKTLGLINLAIEVAPRWSLRKLTETYLTLSLEDISKAVGLAGPREAWELVESMISTHTLHANICPTGTVTFLDPPHRFTQAEVDKALVEIQAQTEMLERLEREVGKSREWVVKAVRTKEEPSWGPSGLDEEGIMGDRVSGGWAGEGGLGG